MHQLHLNDADQPGFKHVDVEWKENVDHIIRPDNKDSLFDEN